MLCGPLRVRRCLERPGPNEHDVGARSQQAHDETVLLAARGDQTVRLRQRRDRGNSVDALYEIRVDTWLGESNSSAVERGELAG